MSLLQAACCCGGSANPCTCGWPNSFTVSASVSGTYPGGYGTVAGSGSVIVSFCICSPACDTENGCWYESRHNGTFATDNPCNTVNEHGDSGQLLWQSGFVNTGGNVYQKQGVKLMGAALYHDGTQFVVDIVTGSYQIIETRDPPPVGTYRDEYQSILYMNCGATACGPVGLSCTACDITDLHTLACNRWQTGTGSLGCVTVQTYTGATAEPCDDPTGEYTGTDSLGLEWTVTVA